MRVTRDVTVGTTGYLESVTVPQWATAASFYLSTSDRSSDTPSYGGYLRVYRTFPLDETTHMVLSLPLVYGDYSVITPSIRNNCYIEGIPVFPGEELLLYRYAVGLASDFQLEVVFHRATPPKLFGAIIGGAVGLSGTKYYPDLWIGRPAKNVVSEFHCLSIASDTVTGAFRGISASGIESTYYSEGPLSASNTRDSDAWAAGYFAFGFTGWFTVTGSPNANVMSWIGGEFL